MLLLSILTLSVIGCANGRKGGLPSMKDYNGVMAEEHKKNAALMWERPDTYWWKSSHK